MDTNKAIKLETTKAIDFIWFNYGLTLDFSVEPMIEYIKSSRKAEAIFIDTDLIDRELLVKELKAKFQA
tara:strand:- start:619 stop:825 length:207 start_codon:yes stop_codon:yes gene_type:complete